MLAAFFLSYEDESTLRKMINMFNTKSPSTSDIKIILTKNMTKCNIFKSELPQIHLRYMEEVIFSKIKL